MSWIACRDHHLPRLTLWSSFTIPSPQVVPRGKMPCDPEIGFGWRSRRRNVRKSLFHTARLADGGRLCCGWSRFWPSGLEGKLTDFDVSESNLYIVVWLTSRCPASTSGTSPHQAMRLRGGTAGAPTCPLEWPALRYGSGGAPAVSHRIFRTTTSPVQARTANAGVPPSWLRALRSRRNTLVRMASAAAKGDGIRNVSLGHNKVWPGLKTTDQALAQFCR
jgi:hypothetical protein